MTTNALMAAATAQRPGDTRAAYREAVATLVASQPTLAFWVQWLQEVERDGETEHYGRDILAVLDNCERNLRAQLDAVATCRAIQAASWKRRTRRGDLPPTGLACSS